MLLKKLFAVMHQSLTDQIRLACIDVSAAFDDNHQFSAEQSRRILSFLGEVENTTVSRHSMLVSIVDSSTARFLKEASDRQIFSMRFSLGVDAFAQIIFRQLDENTQRFFVMLSALLVNLLKLAGLSKTESQAIEDVLRSVEARVSSLCRSANIIQPVSIDQLFRQL